MAMSRQDQLDELQALQAIYDGSADVGLGLPDLVPESWGDDGGIQRDLDVDFSVAIAAEPKTDVQLHVSVPLGYLAAEAAERSSPVFELSSPSLPRWKLSLLCGQLDRLCPERAAEPVLFAWLEWLRLEAWAFLAAGDDLSPARAGAGDAGNGTWEPRVTGWGEDRAELQEDQGLAPQAPRLCDNCSGEVEDGACASLSSCAHRLCAGCLAAVVQVHNACRVAPCCPLPGCRRELPPEVAAEAAAPGPDLWASVSRRVLGTPFQEALVLCPRCEDRGMDIPVITTGLAPPQAGGAADAGDAALLASAAQGCLCFKCGWRFCGVCRSPCHFGHSCFDDEGRVVRMAKRRPPLTPELAELAATMAAEVRRLEEIKAAAMSEALQKYRTNFDALRGVFLAAHHDKIMQGLHGVFGGPVELRPAPLAAEVQKRFMRAIWELPGTELRPAFHGTEAANHTSIFRRGLLVPGQGNDLTVVHGAAHGTGVYTANVDAAWLSRGFCSAPRMLVCAVLQADVRHVRDAMVVRTADHVVPLAEGVGERFADVPEFPRAVAANPPSAAAKPPTQQAPPKAALKAAAKPKSKQSKFLARLAARSQRH